MRIAFLATALAIQQVSGCENSKPTPKPAKITFPVRRFERPSTVAPDIALDTLTGQYCRTWDWHYTKPGAIPSADLQDVPTCISLFRQYPSQITEVPPGFIPDNSK